MEVTPATISPAILTDFFRKELGFEGVIITDALEMGAIIDNLGIGYAAFLALEAGADVFISGTDPVQLDQDWRARFNRPYTLEDQLEAHRVIARAATEGVVTAVHKGPDGKTYVREEIRISPERQANIRRRIDESARRVLAFQARWGLKQAPNPDEAGRTVGAPEHRRLAQQIADSAVTLLKAASGHSLKDLPKDSKIAVIRPSWGRFTRADSAYKTGFVLDTFIRQRHPNTASFAVLEPLPEKKESEEERLNRINAEKALTEGKRPEVTVVRGVQEALRQVQDADVVVIETNFGHRSPFQQELLKQLAATGKRLVHLVMGNPYDAAVVWNQADIVAVGYSPHTAEAMAKLLFEEIKPQGKLPVTVLGAAPRGAGLSSFAGLEGVEVRWDEYLHALSVSDISERPLTPVVPKEAQTDGAKRILIGAAAAATDRLDNARLALAQALVKRHRTSQEEALEAFGRLWDGMEFTRRARLSSQKSTEANRMAEEINKILTAAGLEGQELPASGILPAILDIISETATQGDVQLSFAYPDGSFPWMNFSGNEVKNQLRTTVSERIQAILSAIFGQDLNKTWLLTVQTRSVKFVDPPVSYISFNLQPPSVAPAAGLEAAVEKDQVIAAIEQSVIQEARAKLAALASDLRVGNALEELLQRRQVYLNPEKPFKDVTDLLDQSDFSKRVREAGYDVNQAKAFIFSTSIEPAAAVLPRTLNVFVQDPQWTETLEGNLARLRELGWKVEFSTQAEADILIGDGSLTPTPRQVHLQVTPETVRYVTFVLLLNLQGQGRLQGGETLIVGLLLKGDFGEAVLIFA